LLYAYFSGENFDWDSMITDSYRGWNPMFENQSYGHVANALMPQTNVQLWGIMGTAKPMEDITVKGEYYQYWFVNPWPVLFNYWGDALLMDDTQRFAGQELDLTLTYDYTEDVQFNLLTGWFMPGKSFADINRQDASEVIGSMKVTF